MMNCDGFQRNSTFPGNCFLLVRPARHGRSDVRSVEFAASASVPAGQDVITGLVISIENNKINDIINYKSELCGRVGFEKYRGSRLLGEGIAILQPGLPPLLQVVRDYSRMDKSMLTGLVVGAVVATAGGVIAGLNMLGEKQPEYAEVLNVVEATETVQTPREVCEDVAVTRQAPVKDEHKILGTVTGAVIGGVLGNQVGGGTGKKLATVAGAAAGGYAGNKVQGNMQAKDTYTTTERRCHTVTDSSQKVIGYDVTYRLGDKEATVRMDQRPGNRIPVENGQLVLGQ